MVSHIVRVVSIDAHTARKTQPREENKTKFCHPTRLRIPSPEIVTIIFVFIACILWLVVGTFVPHRINHTKQEKNTDKYFTIMNLYGFFLSFLAGRHTSVANACSRHCSRSVRTLCSLQDARMHKMCAHLVKPKSKCH